MWIWGSEFRVEGLGFRVEGLGFRVWGLRFRVQSLGSRGFIPEPSSLQNTRVFEIVAGP